MCPWCSVFTLGLLGGSPPDFAEFDRVVRGMLNRISTEQLSFGSSLAQQILPALSLSSIVVVAVAVGVGVI